MHRSTWLSRLGGVGVDRRGVSSVEYALLLAFIAGGIILAASELGTAVQNEMNDTANCIETAGAGNC